MIKISQRTVCERSERTVCVGVNPHFVQANCPSRSVGTNSPLNSMYTLEKIKQNIAKEINKALTKNLVQASLLIFPPNPEFGDLSMPCFDIASAYAKASADKKKIGKTATETASWLVGRVEANEFFVSVKAIGPYLNFILNKNYLTENVIKEINKEKEKYGENKSGKNKKVMIEYSNANTHKEYHVGHLRNICYGDAVNKILSANGHKSIPVSYINDFGIHVAKTLWYYEKFSDSTKKIAKNWKDRGYFLGKQYLLATKKLEEDESLKQFVSFMMKRIESRKGPEYKLWQETREWSIKYMDEIYKELGVKFDHIFYESEVMKKGLNLTAELYEKRILEKSEGAIIADLNKYNLGILVFMRSDGTALYPVADLALAEEKFKKYKLDESIYVVDIRQGQYFKQLFKILELMGHKKKNIHLCYDFVKLPTGMMSSRTGNVITYEDLREEVTKKAVQETKKRHKDWSEKKIEQIAEKIVNGAIKFEMIKVSANQVITFDINKALQFSGYTSAYLQYTYARIQSINKKARKPPYIKISEDKQESKKTNIDFDNLTEKKENELIMKLAKYPDVVSKIGRAHV